MCNSRPSCAQSAKLSFFNDNREIALNFDLSDGCNLNCIMCGGKKNAVNQHVMDIQLFKDRVLPFFALLSDFQFGCLYEPLLVPYSEQLLWLCKPHFRPGVKGQIVTNGTLLAGSRIKALIDSDIFRRVRFSVDAPSEKLYEYIRRGANFRKVMSNIRQLVDYRNHKKSGTKIEFNFTIMKENIHELPQMVHLAYEMGLDGITTHKLFPNDTEYVDQAYYDVLLDKINEASELAGEHNISFAGQKYRTKQMYEALVSAREATNVKAAIGGCALLSEALTFRLDSRGNLFVPCLRLNGPVGSLINTAYRDVVKGNKFQDFLRCITNTDPMICMKCYLYRENNAISETGGSQVVVSRPSELDRVIPPEIKEDEFYRFIETLAGQEDIKTILEIGSSAGDGSTEAWVKGLRSNPNKPTLFCLEISKPRFAELQKRYSAQPNVKCYRLSSVSLEKFPSEQQVRSFYYGTKTALNDYPLERVLGWLRQDMEYIKGQDLSGDGIGRIKRENNINRFDAVLIDGSEFTGSAELDEVYGAKFVLLDDINGFKNHQNYKRLISDPNYSLAAENWELRNGFAVFKRLDNALDVHFFTIVLNGQPFIRHHIEVFKQLPFNWHWHIVEGVADLKHDTAWSVQLGGRITEQLHDNGLSNDGTTEYIDELARQFPDNITVYRKPGGVFWEGKLEMVNAPLANIHNECLLWQVDADELWTAREIEKMCRQFIKNPQKTAAYFHCYYFVGPRKYVSSLNTWATYPQDWLRLWRFRAGMKWQAHEPPTLVDAGGQNVARINPFTRDETKLQNITFQHLAYVTESQVRFKEIYYGYKDAVAHWKKLQKTRGPVNPAAYLPWAKADAAVEDWPGTDETLLAGKLLNEYATVKTRHVRIAGEQNTSQNLMAVGTESGFADAINRLFAKIRPGKIIETGTYMGTGTTAAIASSLRRLGITDARFYTIEVNPEHYKQAAANLAKAGHNVTVLNGLSIPRRLLPTLEQIEEKCVRNIEFDDIFVDHKENERAGLYYTETNFDVPDDLLGECLEKFDNQPDFVLLDSAGHMGNIEFNYLLSRLRGPCYIALDDIYHIKHYKSLLQIQKDSRFEMITRSKEKFGFCIVRFTPVCESVKSAAKNLLFVRTDSIGDAVLAASMLPHIRKKYKDAKITVLCRQHIAELYETCPYADDVIAVDSEKMVSDNTYAAQVVEELQQRRFDIAVNSIYSRDKISEFLTINSGAAEKIAFAGDDCNLPLQITQNDNKFYTRLIPNKGKLKPEPDRHRDFLDGLGIKISTLGPAVWTTAEDEMFADDFFKKHSLKPERTIALFPGGQYEYKRYEHYEKVLKSFDEFDFLILGGKDAKAGFAQSPVLPDRCIDLTGKTTIRQMASIIRRCRLYLGADSAGAHIACAVETPNVVLLGGGHFGRFMPYSPLTSVVSLPLDCYWCNWRCRYTRPHCIRDIRPEIIVEAVKKTLSKASLRPRVFVQDASLWTPLPSQPKAKSSEQFLDTDKVEIITLGGMPQSAKIRSAGMADRDAGRYLVSAIVSTYNSEKHIRACLEDLQNQTIADKLEIVVVNSGSQQNEEAVVREFQQAHDNIKYIKTEKRETIYKAWNRAIKASSGKYITNANTDDRHRPDALEKLAVALEKNPDKVLAYGNYTEMKKDEGKPAARTVKISGWFSRQRLFDGECPPAFQPMWRSSVHDEFGYFDEQFFISGDYEFWFRLTQKYDFLYVNETIGECLIGTNNVSIANEDLLSWENEVVINKCYRYALQQKLTVGETGISAHPVFSKWPEVNIWKQKTRAKLENKPLLLTDNIKNTWDHRANPAPELSIVIVTYDSHKELFENLYSLNEQTRKDFEVIVVDNGGDLSELEKRTKEFDFGLCGVELRNNFGPSAARNIGAGPAKAAYIAFLDDDAAADRNLVSNILRHFEESGIPGLRGRVLPKTRIDSNDVPANYDLGNQVIPTACEVSCLSAYRKDILVEAGGFDELLFGCEGTELSYRICKTQAQKLKSIKYFPDVVVYHDTCRGAKQVEKKLRYSSALLLAWRKDHGLKGYIKYVQSFYSAPEDEMQNSFAANLNVAVSLQGNFPEEAVKWAQKAVRLNPSSIRSSYTLGLLYLTLARQAEAAAVFERILEPLKNALANAGRQPCASEFESSSEVADCYLSTCTQLAQCCIGQGALDKVRRIYNDLLNSPNVTIPQQQRTDILSVLSKLDKASSIPALTEKTGIAAVPSEAKDDYLVSAIVSTYNSEKFLAGCLEDLESQTIADKLEIIVVNSGSQQNEEEIVSQFQQKYDNIVYIKTEKREGIYAAWNRAVKVARGKFLTNANTDDRHCADAFEIMAKALMENDNIALVYADQIRTDTENDTFENHHGTKFERRADYSRQRLAFGCCVGSQPMWRKSLHDEFGCFDETLTSAGDWDFWLRISEKREFKHIPEFLGLYYYNDSGIEHGNKIHSLYERYLVGRRYGTEYISVIPYYKTTADDPFVSVIMPLYNAADCAGQAIESVLIQNYPKLELLIVDDGSTDNISEVIGRYEDERIRYLRKENGGAASARNFGLRAAKGQYIVLLDSDDMLMPDYIAEHLLHFRRHADTGLSYCDDCLIDEKHKPIRTIRWPQYTDQKLLIRDLFRHGHPAIPFRACMIKREVFDEIGFYDESLVVAEDYDMMRRFVKKALKARHLEKALYLRTVASDSLSRSFTAEKAKAHFEVIRRITETFRYDELFPDVDWDKIPPQTRRLHARCLAAATYLAIGQRYVKVNSLIYAKTAFAQADSQLNDCLRDDPHNQHVRGLLQKCRSIRDKYENAEQKDGYQPISTAGSA